jgi:hypothetical protein
LIGTNIGIVWIVQEEAMRKAKDDRIKQDLANAEEARKRKEALRKESGLSWDGIY